MTVFFQGPRRGRGWGGFSPPPPPTFFGNCKELLRKRCFQPPHFESLFSPPTFKVAPRALSSSELVTQSVTLLFGGLISLHVCVTSNLYRDEKFQPACSSCENIRRKLFQDFNHVIVQTNGIFTCFDFSGYVFKHLEFSFWFSFVIFSLFNLIRL